MSDYWFDEMNVKGDCSTMMVLGFLSTTALQHGRNSTKQFCMQKLQLSLPSKPPPPHQSLIIKFASSLSISITFLALSLPLTGSISNPFSLNFSGTSSESNNPT